MSIIVVQDNKIIARPSLEQERNKYIKLIQDAQLLGEDEEVTRLQQEWLQRKQELQNLLAAMEKKIR